MSQSQASRLIADLEAELGVRLLSRTTRAVVPTEVGGDFLGRIEPILAALDEAEHSVRDGGELRGQIRMSMPTSFGIRSVIPRLASFVQRHANLRIELLLGDRRQDLIKGAVDAAIRLGTALRFDSDDQADSEPFRAWQSLLRNTLPVCGAPECPEDLVRHRIVGGTAAASTTAWRFLRDGQESAIKLEPHFTTDENEGSIAAAAAGYGITSTSGWACRRELENGTLIRLLPEWHLAGIPVHAYFPMGRATRAAARAAIDHLAEAFKSEVQDEPS